MAKKNKNNKKEERNLQKEMLKAFTRASVFIIVDKLKGIDIGDLFIDIYVKLTDKNLQYLNKEYEKRLLLAVSNPEQFEKDLHPFYMQMADYIQKNKLHHQFYELCYQIFIQLEKRKAKDSVINAYQDLLLQQASYFLGSPAKCVYGVTSDQKLLYMDEPGENLSYINYEAYKVLSKSPYSSKEIIDIFRKNGYPEVRTHLDTDMIVSRDQLLTNMLYYMAPVVNEEVQDIIRKPFRNPSSLLVYKPSTIFNLVDTEKIKQKLKNREVLLPSEGITIHFYKTDDIKELYLREIFRDDTLILLWRIKDIENSYTSGFFDTEEEVFFSVWRESTARVRAHSPIESIVLQQYLRLTTPLNEEEESSLFKFNEVRTEEQGEKSTEPTVYFSITEKKEGTKTGVRRPFDRKKYIADIVNIHPFIRNLPVGAVASEEALLLAKRLGIQLPPGKTLVRGFQRRTWNQPKKQ